MKEEYTFAIVGGTFDRFHDGHKKLIDAACQNAKIIHIGVTTKKFYQNKLLAEIIEPFEERVKMVREYVDTRSYGNRVEIIELKDFYGESLSEKNIDAIFVTEDTQPSAELMNNKREELGLPEMKINVVSWLKTDDGTKITSERIRRGEINRQGHTYVNLFKKNLFLPEFLREELRKPIGKVITSKKQLQLIHSSKHNPYPLITVGDIVTLFAIDAGLHPAVSIIDFKTQRNKIDEEELRKKLSIENETYKNKQGTINKGTVEALQQKINKFLQTNESQIMVIDGEEDLLTLPAILLAPLNSIILYGQVNQGAVIVKVTEEKKMQIQILIKHFKTSIE